MGFERFTKFKKSHKKIVSIRTNGQMGFSQGAIEKFDLNQYKFAILFYDKIADRIGVRLTNNADEEGAVGLRVRKNNAYIPIRPFLDYYEINYTNKTKRFAATLSADGMVVIELKKPLP